MSNSYKNPSLLFDIVFIITMSIITGLVADFLLYGYAGFERMFATWGMIGVGFLFTTSFTVAFRSLNYILDRLLPLNSFLNLSLTIAINSLVMALIFLVVIKIISLLFGTISIDLQSTRFQLLFGLSVVAYTIGNMFYYSYKFYQKFVDAQRKHTESLRAALDAQIKPHFLFNSLNTIITLIKSDPDKAEEATENLADLFRYILESSNTKLISLSKELELVKKYITIEKARFGDDIRFSAELDLPDNSINVPPLILQPLVENSIKHGYSHSLDPLEINLCVVQKNGLLHITVADTGPGFGKAGDTDELFKQGTGLKNIQNKLNAHYGSDAKLSFSGQQVTIALSMESTN